MSGYPFWPARVKRPHKAASLQIKENGGALVKFFGTHDHLYCEDVRTWEEVIYIYIYIYIYIKR